MRLELKTSWLEKHAGNDKRLYRKYRTYYGKIVNINRLFYWHRMTNIPMHSTTIKTCHDKVEVYLKQMDLIRAVLLSEGKIFKHYIPVWIPLGTWEKTVHVSYYMDRSSDIDRKRKEIERLNIKMQPKLTLLERIKLLFK